MTGQLHATGTTAPHRSDAGAVRMGQRDINGLVLCADAADPALLDQLPYAPGLLNQAPAAIRQAIYAAFDIHCLYRHDHDQVTIWATITSTTPGIIQPSSTTPAPAPMQPPHSRRTCLQT